MVLAVAALSFGTAYAADNDAQDNGAKAQTEQVEGDETGVNNDADDTEKKAEPAKEADTEKKITTPEGSPLHFGLMKKFLEGGWEWMLPVLVCLILGLAIAIERILYLTFAQINTKSFVANVERILNEEGVEAAKEYCRNTRGPIASIYY